MARLIHNAVLRIDSTDLNGLYRVVAAPPGCATLWLAYLGPWQSKNDSDKGEVLPALGSLECISRELLQELEGKDRLYECEIQPTKHLLKLPEDLKGTSATVWQSRFDTTLPMLDHERICKALVETGGIGPLVDDCMALGGSKASIYRYWKLFCINGFDASSLNPNFPLCGGPGVLRPVSSGGKKVGPKTTAEQVGEPCVGAQRPIDESDRERILIHHARLSALGLTAQELYDRIIEAAYVTQYRQDGEVRIPVLPPQGSFPNQRQVRHIVDSGVARLERKLRQTTLGHYTRTMRSLQGRAIDGVAGPGHVFAIDSTIGDVHLRSSINRAWLIGRPIVYLVVDVWSTAIVGFYVCLAAPSWNTAKLALFSTFSSPTMMSELWGYQDTGALSPSPAVPAMILSDRGEYLSRGARESCLSLGINFGFNPSYRPDLKGLVEVLNRITKDTQYGFLPGAIDRRRKELEANPKAKESALIVREYVQYLAGTFRHYNLFANRAHRMTTEMLGAGIEPTPAGLWRFGHEVGIGYEKTLPQDRLIRNLLPCSTAVVRRDGIFLESLQYESEIAAQQQWTGHARNFGVMEQPAFYYPGSASRFWWPNPDGGLHQFTLRENARAVPETTIEEWRDALMYEKMKKDDREYLRLQAAQELLARQSAARTKSIALTKAADEAHEGVIPNTHEARTLEKINTSSTVPIPPPNGQIEQADSDSNYDAVMAEVFSQMNRDSAAGVDPATRTDSKND